MFERLRQLFRRTKDSASSQKTDAADSGAHGGTEDDADATPLPEDPHAVKAWLALGLDGALATDNGQGFTGPIGQPVYNTVQRLKDWKDHRGLKVKILTPRAATEEGAQAVRDWLREHNLPALEVTSKKDLNMVELWSARCVQVISNTGQAVGSSPHGLDKPKQPEADAAPPA